MTREIDELRVEWTCQVCECKAQQRLRAEFKVTYGRLLIRIVLIISTNTTLRRCQSLVWVLAWAAFPLGHTAASHHLSDPHSSPITALAGVGPTG